ncbi:MAG: hypothetical protein ACRCT8_17085 [Lacipirellulaceae bacterium]
MATLARKSDRVWACCLAAGLWVGCDHALAVELDEPSPDVAIATDDPNGDGSVLVSKRSEPGEGAATPSLEPISEHSEHEPELAAPEGPEAPPVEVTDQPTTGEETAAREPRRTPRLAVLPTDGDAVLTDVARAYGNDSRPRPSRFHGVLPGSSTKADLLAEWGDPAWVSEARGDTIGGEVLRYDLKPFERVEALVEADTVQVVRVTLADRATVDALAQRLRLQKIDPVNVVDPASNELLGVTFPEKGLTLLTTTDPTSGVSSVTHLVLQPLDARAFVLRAENRPATAFAKQIADLERATEVGPPLAQAYWLKAGVYRLAGKATDAELAAREAVKLDDALSVYRLRWAETLTDVGKHDDAVFEVRKVLDDKGAPDLVRAQALAAMGELAALGEATIAQKAIGFLTASIEIADKLATSADANERRSAKDLLIDTHLAVAREIARRDYGQKTEIVGEWIGRASGLAEDRIANDGGTLDLRLTVAREALAAVASLRPAKDPAPWIKEAQESADTLLATELDTLFRQRVEWVLGEAYQEAVRIEHARGESDQALRYGTRAIERLSAGAEPRATSADAELTVGRLYFYLGAVNAVHKKNHEEAVGWYEKARPILTAERSESNLVVPRREGEVLVSMSVSYWERGQRDTALALTTQGTKLMERAVASGVLDEPALAVPYGNLASMHQQLGNTPDATKFGKLARGARGSAPVAMVPSAVNEAKPMPTGKPKPATMVAQKQPTSKRPLGKQPAMARRQVIDGTTVR